MGKQRNQKPKLLYLARIFSEKTDAEHGLTIQELISELQLYDIPVDRKTLYDDIETLRGAGMDIISTQAGRHHYYKLVSRDFELPELKLLVDTVQAAKFIPETKSRELIKKLESLCSHHEATQLNRQVIISGRVKSTNKQIYYNIDKLHFAISENRQIRFYYWQWNLQKQPERRRGGQLYTTSPWALLWDNEYYYLIGYDSTAQQIRHYRVDKMENIATTEAERDGRAVFDALDIPKYTNTLFGMFSGESVPARLRCTNDMIGVILDRFGTDVTVIPDGDSHFRVTVTVTPSGQFFGWLTGMAGKITLVGPDALVERMRQTVSILNEQYMQ